MFTTRRARRGALVALLCLCACGSPSPRAPTPVAPPMAITFVTRTFVDSTRITPAHGDAPELSSRTLPTTVAVPDGPGPFPLIMFSHGFGSSGQAYADVLRAIASAGYVVAAPDFPVTSEGVPGGPERGVDAPDAQPADVRFVIDQLLADPLAAHIDPHRIGAAGHSMGAGITMGVAFNTCCRDERIGAGVLMAVDPPTLYHGDYFVPPAPPVLVIHGDRDESLPYAGGRRAYETAGPPKYFLTVLGGDHSSAASEVVMAATVDFFDTYLKKRPDGLKRLKVDADRPGVTRLETEPK